MKEEAQQAWEAEVRRVVETHEFEYDPAAWAGMEELLDTTPPATGGNAGSWWAGAWKWLLPIGALLTVGLFWLTKPNTPPSIQGSLPIFPEPVTEIQKAMPATPSIERTLSSMPVPPLAPLPTKPVEPLPMIQPKMPQLQLRRETTSAMSTIPTKPTEPVKYLGRQEEKLPEIDIKRKRNRKALFPDVIKNY